MIFGDLNPMWLEYLSSNCSEQHVKDATSVSVGKKQYFKPLMPLNCLDIKRNFILELYHDGRWGTPCCANRNQRLLKGNLNWGVKFGHIEYNPIDKMPAFRQPKTPKYVPPKEHVELISTGLVGDIKDIYDAYRYTGARDSELRRLKWDDVDFEKNEIVLYTRKKRDRSWTGQPVTIIPELLAILKRRCGGSVYVFGNKEEPPKKNLNRWIKRICAKKKIPYFTTHALRHYAAHTMAERGAPTELVQRVLRHEDIKTTQRYLNGLRTAHEAANFLSDSLYNQD